MELDFHLAKRELLMHEQFDHPNIIKVEDAYFNDKAGW